MRKEFIKVKGIEYPRIKHSGKNDCYDCGCKTNEVHDLGCDLEECPVCGEQLITCGHLEE